MRRFRWSLRQLIPRTYRTTVGRGGSEHFVVWRMWLGHVWNVDDITIAQV